MNKDLSSKTYTQRWLPSGGAGARPCGVYLLHGTGEHCERYDAFARVLADDGWVVGAHDHPGHGRSFGKQGSVSPNGLLAVQAAMQIQTFAEETGAPPILFGHSLGGVVASELVLSHQLPVSGLILSSPAFRPIITIVNRVKLVTLYTVAPDKAVRLKYRPEALTHDDTIRNLSLQDPLIHTYRSARMVRYMLDSGAQSIAKSHTLKTPTLALIAGADPVIETAAIDEWVAGAPEQWMTKKTYQGAFHELLNELPETRNRVAEDILQWLNNKATA